MQKYQKNWMHIIIQTDTYKKPHQKYHLNITSSTLVYTFCYTPSQDFVQISPTYLTRLFLKNPFMYTYQSNPLKETCCFFNTFCVALLLGCWYVCNNNLKWELVYKIQAYVYKTLYVKWNYAV